MIKTPGKRGVEQLGESKLLLVMEVQVIRDLDFRLYLGQIPF